MGDHVELQGCLKCRGAGVCEGDGNGYSFRPVVRRCPWCRGTGRVAVTRREPAGELADHDAHVHAGEQLQLAGEQLPADAAGELWPVAPAWLVSLLVALAAAAAAIGYLAG